MSDKRIATARTRDLLLLLAISIGVFSTPLAADTWNVHEGNKFNGDGKGVSPDGKWELSTTIEWHGPGSDWPLGGVDVINSISWYCIDDPCKKNDRYDFYIKDKACVCTEMDKNSTCIKLYGNMAYINKAYGFSPYASDTAVQFDYIGLKRVGGCGGGAYVINGRHAGYLRLHYQDWNVGDDWQIYCIQSVADPANNGSTHLWDKCGTGDNQQRRVITYDTQEHQLQFASDTSLCLVAQPLPTPPNGFPAPPITPIVVKDCATAPSEQRDWEFEGNMFHLLSDTSKCIMTTEASAGAAIVLGDCSVGPKASWQLTWTRDRPPSWY